MTAFTIDGALVPLIATAPWLVLLVWFGLRDRGSVFPHDDTIPSSADRMLRRS